MQPQKENHTQYITDNLGVKKAVVIPIDEYEDMLENLKDLASIAERRNEPTVSHDELIKQLKNDGLI